MDRPVLGIICCNHMLGDEAGHAVVARYVAAAGEYADADILLVPALAQGTANVVARLDGILLTGSRSNVTPARYGDAAAGTGPFDGARDAAMLDLVDACRAAGKPVFGICRGLQEINVAFGGTLCRDVAAAGDLAHHAPDTADHAAAFDHCHDVALEPAGLLARACGGDRLAVNSVHYQGIDRLGDGLRIEARAGDGLIEAVAGEVGGAPLLAVQWHPEWRTGEFADRRRFFGLLGRALRGATAAELAA